jgi:hypothetical protein
MPIFKTSDGPDERTLEAQIATTLDGSDDARRKALGLMERLGQAKVGSLKRERKRVAALRGEQSDVVAALDARIAAHADSLALTRADGQRARATSAAPLVSTDAGTVHGRVIGADLAGIVGIAVTAVDTAGKSYGRATTDAKGYFRLAIPAPSTTPAVEGRVNVGGATTSPALRLVIRQDDREVVRSTSVLVIKAGDVQYVEVQVPSPGA